MGAEGKPADVTGTATRVTLRGGDLPWRSVSPKLARVRLITLAVILAVPLLASMVLAVVLTPWLWLAGAGLVLLGCWIAWVIIRQVSAISWIELEEELVIRKGRILRSLVSVPYGRLQYVDIESGPLMRAHGLAQLEIHTSSPESGGNLPGLTVAEAEDLRARLAARGESLRAGL